MSSDICASSARSTVTFTSGTTKRTMKSARSRTSKCRRTTRKRSTGSEYGLPCAPFPPLMVTAVCFLQTTRNDIRKLEANFESLRSLERTIQKDAERHLPGLQEKISELRRQVDQLDRRLRDRSGIVEVSEGARCVPCALRDRLISNLRWNNGISLMQPTRCQQFRYRTY